MTDSARREQLSSTSLSWPTHGWPTSSPADHGIANAALAEADRRLREEFPTTFCLLIVRHGFLIVEQYYHGHDHRTRFDVRSVTKSVLATLVGITSGDRLLELDHNLAHLLPDRLAAVAAGRTGAITVEHLLTMTAGFSWDDLADWWRLVGSNDWLNVTLGTPLADDPGRVFTYNSGCSQILSAILTRVTGQRLADIAATRLFSPLGITPGPWPTDPQGHNIGAYGLNLTARDLAKLGLLYLRGGRWGDDQLVPTDYVRRATVRHSDGGFPEGTAYGYHWWVTAVAGQPVFFAAGYGGQYLFVAPGLDLVVVTTAEWQAPPEELFEPRPVIEAIIAAAS